MHLVLQIVSHQRAALGPSGCKVFDQRGGSLGRGADNDWVLPDEQRYLSSRHAVILHRDGRFYLDDVSTNGVYLNGAAEVVGRGHPVALSDGDRLRIGDYDVGVKIDQPAASHLFADPDPQAGMEDSRAVDPLAALGFAESAPQVALDDDPFAGLSGHAVGTEPDHVPAENQFFEPPRPATQAIPDNWDETSFGRRASPAGFQPRRQAHERSPLNAEGEQSYAPVGHGLAPPQPGPRAGASMPAHQADPAAPYTHVDAGSQAYCTGAGVTDAVQSADIGADFMTRQGAIFREMIQGLMDVLKARTTVKSTFRMPVTTIKPVENNPLKFPISADEALRYLLAPQGSGYLSADAACREGFQDLRDHQLAMMAGMQAALQALLAHFDPKTLEAAFAKKMGLLSRKKTAYWDRYADFFKQTARDAVEDNFQSMLGEAFASAYEEQIRRLQAGRRSRSA